MAAAGAALLFTLSGSAQSIGGPSRPSRLDQELTAVLQTAGFTGGLLRYVQSGNVQRYAAFLFAGVVIFAIIFTRV